MAWNAVCTKDHQGGTFMRIEILRNPSEFLHLRADWEHLTRTSGQENPYLSFIWQWAAYKHFYQGNGDLAIAVASDDERRRGILPLIRTRRASSIGLGVRQLQFLAPPKLAMTGLGAIGDDEAQSFLWNNALEIIGQQLVYDEIILTGLWKAPQSALKLDVLDTNPVFDLPTDWDTCFNSFSANKRKELRRRERELLQLGPLGLAVVTAPDDVVKWFPTLVRLNEERFKVAGINGGLSNKTFMEFHRDVAPQLAAAGRVRLFLLKSSGIPIAFLYILTGDGHYHSYLAGHATAFDRFGLGTLLDSFMIRHAITVDHAKTIDFGPGAQTYKLRFAPRLVTLFEHRRTCKTLLGTVLAGHRSLRAKFHKMTPNPPPGATCPAP